MKIIHSVKDLPILLFALLSVTTLFSLPQAKSAWAEVKEVYSEQDFGLRILREAMLVGLASQQGNHEHLGLDSRMAGGGRLVWNASESTLSVCRVSDGRDKQEGVCGK